MHNDPLPVVGDAVLCGFNEVISPCDGAGRRGEIVGARRRAAARSGALARVQFGRNVGLGGFRLSSF